MPRSVSNTRGIAQGREMGIMESSGGAYARILGNIRKWGYLELTEFSEVGGETGAG